MHSLCHRIHVYVICHWSKMYWWCTENHHYNECEKILTISLTCLKLEEKCFEDFFEISCGQIGKAACIISNHILFFPWRYMVLEKGIHDCSSLVFLHTSIKVCFIAVLYLLLHICMYAWLQFFSIIAHACMHNCSSL